MDVIQTGDAARPFRTAYGREDRSGAMPAELFSDWHQLEQHARSLRFMDWAIRECEGSLRAGKTYTFRASWRDEFETFWRA
jgi:hypothetical protein